MRQVSWTWDCWCSTSPNFRLKHWHVPEKQLLCCIWRRVGSVLASCIELYWNAHQHLNPHKKMCRCTNLLHDLLKFWTNIDSAICTSFNFFQGTISLHSTTCTSTQKNVVSEHYMQVDPSPNRSFSKLEPPEPFTHLAGLWWGHVGSHFPTTTQIKW